MSYRNGLDYLESKTKVLELVDRFGARVAICPDWNGRVMTSSSDGLDGTSYGLIHVTEIDANPPHSSGFGGEDQFSLSPEGGPFSLDDVTSKPKCPAVRRHTPCGFQEGPFTVDMAPPAPQIRMRRSLQMSNSAGTTFDFDVVRTIHLLNSKDVGDVFGEPVAVALEQADVSFVGFETINTLHNRGTPLNRKSGLVSIRIRSMFNSGQEMVAIVPFWTGEDAERGPTIRADFFGTSPHKRLRVLPQAALLRADGKYRCQVGVSRKRVLPFLGAIDFRTGLMTLTTFTLPSEPWEYDYLGNEFCETTGNTGLDFVSIRGSRTSRQTEDSPYSGEVVRAYNHGPSAPGNVPTARFYEFNVFSPAATLARGESLMHHQYTAHINADNQTLAYLAQTILGVDYEQVYKKMIR